MKGFFFFLSSWGKVDTGRRQGEPPGNSMHTQNTAIYLEQFYVFSKRWGGLSIQGFFSGFVIKSQFEQSFYSLVQSKQLCSYTVAVAVFCFLGMVESNCLALWELLYLCSQWDDSTQSYGWSGEVIKLYEGWTICPIRPSKNACVK